MKLESKKNEFVLLNIFVSSPFYYYENSVHRPCPLSCDYSVCVSKEEKILDFGLYRLADKMLAFFQRILDWIKSLFWKEEMELTLVGLQYSGKTTFVNVIAVSVYLRLLCFVLNFNYPSSVACVLRAYFTLIFVFESRIF